MPEETTAVSIQRLEDKIISGFTALETFIEHHKREHEMLAQMVTKAKEALDRELHSMNQMKDKMAEERNMYPTKDTLDTFKAAITKHVDDFRASAEARMNAIEQNVTAISSGSANNLSGSDRANKAWLAGIALAFTILGFLIKLYFDYNK